MAYLYILSIFFPTNYDVIAIHISTKLFVSVQDNEKVAKELNSIFKVIRM